MPRKQSNRRRHKKKVQAGSILSSRYPLPYKQIRKLRYCDNVLINPPAILAATHVFSLNGMYDPDFTHVVNHQPFLFDQMMVLYDHYTVLSAKISVTPINNSTNVPVIFGVLINDTATPPSTSTTTLREQGNSRWNYAGDVNNQNRRTVSQVISISKYLGKKHLLENDDCRGSASANPAEQVYAHVWTGAADGISNPATFTYQITIEYIAVFTEPKELAPS